MEENRKMPLYETRVLQVYPNDAKERKTIQLYESGFWELVTSERIQERHGNTISTFIRMTFRRDKNIPHYQEIAAASRDLEFLQDKQSGVTADEKKYATKFLLYFILGIILLPACIVFWPMAYKAYKKARAAQSGQSGEFDKQEQAALAKITAVRDRYGI